MSLTQRNSIFGSHGEHTADNLLKLFWVLLRNRPHLASDDSFVKWCHVFCLKRQLQCSHLVSYASKGPNIALKVIWFVAPHFWTSIVRRASLRVIQTVLSCYLRYIQVADFDDVVVRQKDVCRLHSAILNVRKKTTSLYPYLLLDRDAWYVGSAMLEFLDTSVSEFWGWRLLGTSNPCLACS